MQIILEEFFYRIIFLFKRNRYDIPEDTTKENIVRKNMLVNSIVLLADIVCAVVVVIGLNEPLATYVGLMTIVMYVFAEHVKIYCENYEMLSNREYKCLIRKKEMKYLKKYLPNLKYAIVSGSIFIALLFMFVCEVTEYYDLRSSMGYKVIMLGILIYMMLIKAKYFILNTFLIAEFRFIKKETI